MVRTTYGLLTVPYGLLTDYLRTSFSVLSVHTPVRLTGFYQSELRTGRTERPPLASMREWRVF